MRRSLDPQWIVSPTGLVGISLGNGHWAEHDFGVEPMRNLFGVDDTKDGLERRVIHTVPGHLRLVDSEGKPPNSFDDVSGIFLVSRDNYRRQPDAWLKTDEFERRRGESLVCAWGESTFGIFAHTSESREQVKTLWKAFKALDVAFWVNSGVFHGGSGLTFCIASKLNAEEKEAILKVDMDQKLLKQEAENIGIEKLLKAAGKVWHALIPSFVKFAETPDTKFKVIYFLNPQDQAHDNSGWFTVEHLQQWAKNKGPIPKTKKQLADEAHVAQHEGRVRRAK